MSVKIYRADQITASLANIILRGYADGEFVRIEQEADAFGDTVGTDGEVTRWMSKDPRSTITVILMASSDANDALSALHELDINQPGGAGVGVFQCRDNNGRSIYRAGSCWIAKAPNISYAREVPTREWKLRGVTDRNFVGGNITVG